MCMEKLCRKCNEILPLVEFVNLKGSVTPFCLSCDNKRRSRYVRDGIYAPIELLDTKHQGIVKETREMLERMGYDLKKDIHLQFIDRAEKYGYKL